MIKRIVILLLSFPLFAFAQNKNLTYAQANDIKYAKTYKNNTAIISYETKDGLTIKVGDTLTIGKAIIKREKYMINDVFSHIVAGKAKGVDNDNFVYLPHNYSGSKVIVKSIFVTHKKEEKYVLWAKRKEMPLYVSIFVKNPKQGFSKKLSRKTILDIDKALSSGEIINKNAPLSKQEAIKKLKESKDLMELGFLSKEKYDKLKEKLTPIILDK